MALMKLRASKGTPKFRFLREACFVSIFFNLFFKSELEQFELILKQKRYKLASQFQSLVAVIVFIIQFGWIM